MPLLRREDETVTRRAIEMHERDREQAADDAARSAAMTEAEVPPEYFQRAREALATEREARRMKIIAAVAFVVGAVWFAWIFWPAPRANPISIYMGRSEWTTAESEGTKVSYQFAGEAGQDFARIKVDGFQKTPEGYWANLRFQRPIRLNGLQEVHFQARSSGLKRLRIRFISGDKNWVALPVTLTGEWTKYSVPLGTMKPIQRTAAGFERLPGMSRPDDEVEELQIQVGEFVNPADATGTVDISEIGID